jgi:hypothetical protein
MNRLLFTSLFLFWASSNLSGQYSLKFHLDGSKNTNTGWRIHEHDQSYFVYVSTIIDSVDGYTIQSGLLKLDLDCNILWKNQYIRDLPPYSSFRVTPYSDLMLSKDTIIFWGSSVNTDGFIFEQILLRASIDGKFNEYKTIHKDSIQSWQSYQELKNSKNEVIQLCAEFKDGTYQGMAFLRMNTNYELIESKSIVPNTEWRLNGYRKFLQVNDSTYAIITVGGKRIAPTPKDSFWTYIMLYDRDFNYIKHYQYLARDYWSTTDYKPTLNKRPGGYYLVGEPYDKYKAFPIYDSQPTVVMGLDSAFNIVWKDTMWYEIGTYVAHKFSISCSNGDLLNVFSYRQSPETKAYSMIMRRDKDGNVLWKRIVQERYGGFYNFGQDLYSGIEDSEGNFVFVGYIEVFDPINRFSGWVLKLDADGCFNNGCTSEEVIIDQVTSVLNVWEKSDVPLVMPNPVQDQARIELPTMNNGKWELNIYTTSGELMQSTNGLGDGSDNNIPIDASTLPNGVYFGQIKLSNNLFYTIKIIVIH